MGRRHQPRGVPCYVSYALVAVGQERLERSGDFQHLLRAIRNERTLGEGIGEKGSCSEVNLRHFER
ncbi:MAG: hypothetical protein HY217_02990 [Candidatus Rokubacteria bacterium]|nr:hypothetical protein [Candidatus Rokubacteria bacterium]